MSDSFFPLILKTERVVTESDGKKLDKKKNIYDLYRDVNFEEAKTICNEILTKSAVYYQNVTSSKV